MHYRVQCRPPGPGLYTCRLTVVGVALSRALSVE